MNSETLEFLGHLSQEYSSNLGWAGVVVTVLSVLVTALIGYQIYNHIQIRNEMKKVVENALQDYKRNTIPIFKGVINIANSKAYFLSNFPQAIDDDMNSLEDILKSDDGELRQLAIKLIMDNLYSIKIALTKMGLKPQIYIGKRSKYLYLLNKIDNEYKDDIIELIRVSVEIELPVDIESAMRVVPENLIKSKLTNKVS